MRKFLILFFLHLQCTFALAETTKVQKFLFIGGNSGKLQQYQTIINQHHFDGIQVVYTWKSLEPAQDRYDLSRIENDLLAANRMHMKLFIQIQDRFFEPQAKNVPTYLIKNPEYAGGLTMQQDNPGENKPVVTGWVASQWNYQVRARYQKLLQALGNKFDGRIYGINLPETAIDIDQENNPTFSCDKYFNAELENLKVAKKSFQHSYVVQYVNFFPCEWNNDHNYMNRLFQFAMQNNIGLGGPDVVPYKHSQMQNSYPFFHKYKDKLTTIAMAIQEPTLSYINPKTQRPYTPKEFTNFAIHYLGAKIIFWDVAVISA